MEKKRFLAARTRRPEIETLAHGFLEIRFGMSFCDARPHCLLFRQARANWRLTSLSWGGGGGGQTIMLILKWLGVH